MSWTKLWEFCQKKIKSFFGIEEEQYDPQFVTQVLHGGGRLKKRYAHFKRIIQENDVILDLMASFSRREEFIQDPSRFVAQVESLLEHTLAFVQALNDLSENRYPWLFEVYDRLQAEIRKALEPLKKAPKKRYIYFLENISREDAYQVGGKAANLAEAHNALGLSIPKGLVVSISCFRELLKENDLEEFIRTRLLSLDMNDPKGVSKIAQEIQEKILRARLPDGFERDLLKALETLGPRFWAVRSSALGEDGPQSFAGQFVSLLNVPLHEVPRAYLKVVASLYNERVLFYRLAKGLKTHDLAMAVLILEMIPARSAGVLYTLNPSRPQADEMLISAVWGLGKFAVGGDIQPDIFVLDRTTGRLKEERIARKTLQVVPRPEGGVKEEEVPPDLWEKPCLKAAELSRLHQMALLLEGHFKHPQDIEWSIDTRGWLYLLQTRPLKVQAVRRDLDTPKGKPLKEGLSVSPGAVSGPVYWLEGLEDLEKIPEKVILVVPSMAPELAKIVPRIRGLIALRGSAMTHLATILREFQVPAVVEEDLSVQELPPGQIVTLDAFSGRIYLGHQEDILKARQERILALAQTPKKQDQGIERVLNLILPLTLTEIPEEGPFDPKNIRTIHDLVRFVHEVSVREMFLWGTEGQEGLAHILVSPLVPMIFYIIDLEGGLAPQATFKKKIQIDDIRSIPFLALWRGMSHPGVRWAGAVPFELGSFVSVVSRSFVKSKDLSGKAFALISREYLNFHSRLAYHFAVVDAFCSERSATGNYVALRFQGGGAGIEGRLRRLVIMQRILQHLGFRVNIKGDRLTAVLRGTSREETEKALDYVGRLLAYVRQMDMAATDEEAINRYVKAFLEEDYSVVQQ